MQRDVMNGRLSRRRLLQYAGGAGAMTLLATPSIVRAQASADVEKAVEWARTNLPASTADIIRAAAGEGKVVLTLQLHGDDVSMRKMIDAFNVRYPFVTVDYTLQNSSQVMQKFNAEVTSGQAVSDYVHLPSNLLNSEKYINEGHIANFVVSQDDKYPAASKQSGVWYPVLAQHGTTCYREGALTGDEVALVRTYKGLTDPRFKGRIGIVSISTSNGQGGCYMLQYGPDPSLWDGLVANQPKVKAASSPLTDGLLAGEYDVCLMNGFSIAARAAQDGAPLRFGISAPSPVTFAPGAIPAKAPHPNAARLWQDWFNSLEAQNIWVEASGAMSAMDGADPCWSQRQSWFFEDKTAQMPMDWKDFSEKQKGVIDRFQKEIQAG